MRTTFKAIQRRFDLKTTPDTLIAQLLHDHLQRAKPGSPMAPSIAPNSTFVLPGEPAGDWQYGRMSNPAWSELEQALSLLEQAPALVFPSGMAAIAATLLANVSQGDRILLPSDGYYTTRVMAERYLKPMDRNTLQSGT